MTYPFLLCHFQNDKHNLKVEFVLEILIVIMDNIYEEARIYLNEVAQWEGNTGKLKVAADAQKILDTIVDE